jgi:hypothetical protein
VVISDVEGMSEFIDLELEIGSIPGYIFMAFSWVYDDRVGSKTWFDLYDFLLVYGS